MDATKVENALASTEDVTLSQQDINLTEEGRLSAAFDIWGRKLES